MKCVGIRASGKVAAIDSPVANGLGHPAHQGANSAFAFGGSHGSMQILAGNDVGCGHRPIFRSLYIFLLKDRLALCVGNRRRTQLPLELVVGRCTRLGEVTTELETWRFLSCRGGGCGHRLRGCSGCHLRLMNTFRHGAPTQGFAVFSLRSALGCRLSAFGQ